MNRQLDIISDIELYLGKNACEILLSNSYRDWSCEKSIESDPDLNYIYYIFPKNGLELRCDINDRIDVIFLYRDKYGGFDERFLKLPFTWDRHQVRSYLGSPSQSGEMSQHPILGVFGARDTFRLDRFSTRIGYCSDREQIENICIMQLDWRPGA